MSTKLDKPEWVPYCGMGTITVPSPGFVWDVRVSTLTNWISRISSFTGVLTELFVEDTLIAGVGTHNSEIGGVIPREQSSPSDALSKSKLVRWLAKAPQYPTAFLPGMGVTWTPMNDTTARASVRGVSVEFSFGADGLVNSCLALDRPRETPSGFESLQWSCMFGEYVEVSAARMKVPTYIQVRVTNTLLSFMGASDNSTPLQLQSIVRGLQVVIGNLVVFSVVIWRTAFPLIMLHCSVKLYVRLTTVNALR